MRTWRLIDVDTHRAVGEVETETWGVAIECFFPAKCAEGDMNAVWFNGMTGPNERREPITEDGHRYLVIPAGREYLPDRLRRYAQMFEEAANDLDNCEDYADWCEARWARKCFDDIAADYLADAADLERTDAMEDA